MCLRVLFGADLNLNFMVTIFIKDFAVFEQELDLDQVENNYIFNSFSCRSDRSKSRSGLSGLAL